jgi:hypothetical protein
VIPAWFIAAIAAMPAKTGLREMRWGSDSAHYAEGWERPTGAPEGNPAAYAGIPRDARYKSGSGGQFIGYVPSLDLVIARQTGGSGQWQYEEFLRRACAASRIDAWHALSSA